MKYNANVDIHFDNPMFWQLVGPGYWNKANRGAQPFSDLKDALKGFSFFGEIKMLNNYT